MVSRIAEAFHTPSEAGRGSSISVSDSGFTLVEILVSATILFTCLAAAAISYNTGVRLVNRMNSAVTEGIALGEIQKNVKHRLFEGEMSGEHQWSDDIRYQWHASPVKDSRNILRWNEDDAGELVYGRFQVKLYLVALALTSQHEGRSQLSRYEYQELVWHPVATH